MRKATNRNATITLLMALVVIGISIFPCDGQSTESAIDPQADLILKRMCAYLDSLQQFSVHTQNTIEDTLDSGHRVDFDIAAEVAISRPNKLRAERKGDLIDQVFFYDGKTLTLYNPADKVYAKKPAPGTIEEMLSFAHNSLGLIIPVGDLVYRNPYPLLMQGVTMAVLIGKSIINGVTCDHMLFSQPGVDFQVWVSDSDLPLPYKYVVTDTATPAGLSISTVMSQWDVKSSIVDDRFSFVPPKNAKVIDFMPF